MGKPGRPPGSKNLKSMQKTSITRTRKSDQIDDDRQYVCVSCGEVFDNAYGKFYKVNSSHLWDHNNKYCPICTKCLKRMFDEAELRFGTKTAMIIICHYLDAPFSNALYDSMNENNQNFTIGTYTKMLNTAQYNRLTFMNTLVNGELLKSSDVVREEKEAKWTGEDLRNKHYVISTVGYDPYDDDIYSDADRKFLFNTLSGYLEDDVVEDSHRLQSAITLIPTILQRTKVDRLINEQLALKNSDSNLLKTLVETKTGFDRSINSLANENGFSIKTSGGAKRHNSTLTGIMREMIDSKFEECKVNSVEARMSKVMSAIASVSNQNLLDQLNWQEDDYARMVATQREMIQKYERENLALEEQNRMMRKMVEAYGGELPKVGDFEWTS